MEGHADVGSCHMAGWLAGIFVLLQGVASNLKAFCFHQYGAIPVKHHPQWLSPCTAK